jgi:hypothetical protein
MAAEGEEVDHITMAGHPPATLTTTWAEITDASHECYPSSPMASSEGWLDKLGDGPNM